MLGTSDLPPCTASPPPPPASPSGFPPPHPRSPPVPERPRLPAPRRRMGLGHRTEARAQPRLPHFSWTDLVFRPPPGQPPREGLPASDPCGGGRRAGGRKQSQQPAPLAVAPGPERGTGTGASPASGCPARPPAETPAAPPAPREAARERPTRRTILVDLRPVLETVAEPWEGRAEPRSRPSEGGCAGAVEAARDGPASGAISLPPSAAQPRGSIPGPAAHKPPGGQAPRDGAPARRAAAPPPFPQRLPPPGPALQPPAPPRGRSAEMPHCRTLQEAAWPPNPPLRPPRGAEPSQSSGSEPHSPACPVGAMRWARSWGGPGQGDRTAEAAGSAGPRETPLTPQGSSRVWLRRLCPWRERGSRTHRAGRPQLSPRTLCRLDSWNPNSPAPAGQLSQDSPPAWPHGGAVPVAPPREGQRD
ncbi:uncharacterized protein LOC142818988 [Pelodiscus sinensis]|uniref:uncharacterized protein LOC142818988 n=1 Tax=Pelodiscus sinensis TaxID=13735 RepID=UPI003F6D900D